MKRTFTKIFAAFVALCFSVPQMQAVITVADDYLWYDTGILADSTGFEFPEWMKKTEKITYRKKGKMSRANDFMYSLWGTDVRGVDLWGIFLPKGSGTTPGDSLILNLPVCDSIYIQGGLTGKGLHAIVTYNDTTWDWYSGASSGYPNIIAFRPRKIKDSLQVIIYAGMADCYSSKGEGKGSDYGTIYNQFYNYSFFSATPKRSVTYKGERYNLHDQDNSINRIKIFGELKAPVVPAFDGSTIAEWSFLYQPTATGTVDTTKLAPDNGTWEGGDKDDYTLYASDKGVVRGVLSVPANKFKNLAAMQLGNECGAPGVKIANIGKNNSTNFSDRNTFSSKFYEIAISTLGYKDIEFNFDFNLRDCADSCVLAYSTDQKTYTVIGTYERPEDFVGLTKVSVKVPEISNLSKVYIALMPCNGEYGESGEFVLANVSFKGSVSEKVAYINDGKSSDIISSALKDYKLTMVNANSFNIDSTLWATDSLHAEEITVKEMFKNYDAVILSDKAGTTSAVTTALHYLIGNKPVLNFKAFANDTATWSWATPASGVIATETETKAAINEKYLAHPIFNGLNIENNTVTLFDSLVVSTLITPIDSIKNDTASVYYGVQGFVTNTYTGPQSTMLATAIGSNDVTCIQEINSDPAQKYLMIGLSNSSVKYLSADGKSMIINAVEYLLGDTAYKLADAIKPMYHQQTNVFTKAGIIYIESEVQSTVNVYNVLGQKVKSLRIDEGTSSIQGLCSGQIYLLNISGNVIKIKL